MSPRSSQRTRKTPNLPPTNEYDEENTAVESKSNSFETRVAEGHPQFFGWLCPPKFKCFNSTKNDLVNRSF